MNTVIKKLIEKINCINSNLNPPLENELLMKYIKLGKLDNPEILDIYETNNGNEFNYLLIENLMLCSFGNILPIDKAVELNTSNNVLKFNEKKLFPFISSFSGEYLLINMKDPNKCIKIYSPSLFIIEPIPIFENLASFLNCILKCYEFGAYIINKNKLEVDFDKEEIIFSSYDKLFVKWMKNN